MSSPTTRRRGFVGAAGATVLAGILTYVFLGIVSRASDAVEFDAFSAFWSLALLVGFGFFLPVEQELARLGVASRLGRASVRRAFRVAAEIAAALVVLLAAGALLLTGPLGLAPELVWCLAAVVVVSVVQYTARGWLLGTGRHRGYARALVLDNVLRVVLAAAVWLLAAAGVVRLLDAWFAGALALAILLAHLAALRFRPERPSVEAAGPATAGPATAGLEAAGPEAAGEAEPTVAALRRAVLALLGASLAAQLLVNLGPVLVQAFGEVGDAGAFQASFNIARVPLFLVVPLQGILVPPLAELVRRGERGRLAAAMFRTAAVVLGLAAVGAVVSLLIGPWVVELVFGAGRALPGADIALLVGGVCLYVGLVLFTQALVAAVRHRAASVAWVVALAAGAIATVLTIAPFGAVRGVGFALLVGSAAGWVVALLQLRSIGRERGR